MTLLQKRQQEWKCSLIFFVGVEKQGLTFSVPTADHIKAAPTIYFFTEFQCYKRKMSLLEVCPYAAQVITWLRFLLHDFM